MSVFESRSRAGWLQFVDGRSVLAPVPHWRVRYDVLDQYTGFDWARNLSRATCVQKYAQFQRQGRKRNVWFEGNAEPCPHAHGDKMSLVYRALSALSSGRGKAVACQHKNISLSPLGSVLSNVCETEQKNFPI